jgi:hypothetical protein
MKGEVRVLPVLVMARCIPQVLELRADIGD